MDSIAEEKLSNLIMARKLFQKGHFRLVDYRLPKINYQDPDYKLSSYVVEVSNDDYQYRLCYVREPNVKLTTDGFFVPFFLGGSWLTRMMTVIYGEAWYKRFEVQPQTHYDILKRLCEEYV